MNQLRKAGIAEVYFRPRGASWVIIIEAKDSEEASRHIIKIPAFGLFDVECDPLVDFNKTLNMLFENLEQSDNLLPGGTVK